MSVSKIYYTEKTVKAWIHDIIRDLRQDGFEPDYIVGLTRGGLVPAVMLSHYLDVPMHSLKVSLRDDIEGTESNLWMAEDAYNGKKILVVDDINDSGATLNWIREDWPSGCFPNDPRWKEVWGNTVRFAIMVNNDASEFKDVDYVGQHINKLEQPVWCVFPWEEWWR